MGRQVSAGAACQWKARQGCHAAVLCGCSIDVAGHAGLVRLHTRASPCPAVCPAVLLLAPPPLCHPSSTAACGGRLPAPACRRRRRPAAACPRPAACSCCATGPPRPCMRCALGCGCGECRAAWHAHAQARLARGQAAGPGWGAAGRCPPSKQQPPLAAGTDASWIGRQERPPSHVRVDVANQQALYVCRQRHGAAVADHLLARGEGGRA